jgi:hypothetical protein
MDMHDLEDDGFQQRGYGTEVLCSGWNPLVVAVVEPIGQVYRELFSDLTVTDAEGFLRQFYRCQRS